MAQTTSEGARPEPGLGSPLAEKVVLYVLFAAAVFMPYGLNLLVLAAAWALAISIKPRDTLLTILLTLLSLAGSILWTFLPA